MGRNGRETLEIAVLHDVSHVIAQSANLHEIVYKTFEILDDRMDMSRGTLRLLNPVNNEIVTEVAYGVSEEAKRRGKYKVGEGVTGRVIEKGEPAVIPRVDEDPMFLNRTRARGDITRKDISFICVPVKSGDEIFGAISTDRVFSDTIDFSEFFSFLLFCIEDLNDSHTGNALIQEGIHL